jgi:hypothetical protein
LRHPEGCDLLNRFQLCTPGDEVVQGMAIFPVLRDIPVLECDDPIALVERQRGVDEGIEHGEEARADRNSYGDADTTDHREAGRLPQHPPANPEVQRHAAEPGPISNAAPERLHSGEHTHRRFSLNDQARDTAWLVLLVPATRSGCPVVNGSTPSVLS